MLDSIYHLSLKLLLNQALARKQFCHIHATLLQKSLQ